MTENALKGIYNGGTIPFGYMIDETRHYQPDPLLAPYRGADVQSMRTAQP